MCSVCVKTVSKDNDLTSSHGCVLQDDSVINEADVFWGILAARSFTSQEMQDSCGKNCMFTVFNKFTQMAKSCRRKHRLKKSEISTLWQQYEISPRSTRRAFRVIMFLNKGNIQLLTCWKKDHTWKSQRFKLWPFWSPRRLVTKFGDCVCRESWRGCHFRGKKKLKAALIGSLMGAILLRVWRNLSRQFASRFLLSTKILVLATSSSFYLFEKSSARGVQSIQKSYWGS